jgi:3-(3-hydroxy-phenyl)propionate hydroxylase
MHGSGSMAEAARDYMSHVSQSIEAMTDHDQANAMTRSLLGVRVDPTGQGRWRMAVGSDGRGPIQVGDRLPDVLLRRGDGTHIFTHDLTRDSAISLLFADVRRRPTLPNDADGLCNFVVSRWDAPLKVEAGAVVLVRPDEFIAAIGSSPENDGASLYESMVHPLGARAGVVR